MRTILQRFTIERSPIRQEGKSKEVEDEDGLDDDDLDGETTKKPLKTTFELNDTLYAEAELEDTDTVYLWLGVRAHLNSYSNSDQLIIIS